jgi:hypothetical protein
VTQSDLFKAAKIEGSESELKPKILLISEAISESLGYNKKGYLSRP